MKNEIEDKGWKSESDILNLIEQSVDENGNPLFGIIEGWKDDCRVKMYKQVSRFTNADCRKAAEYQSQIIKRHENLAAHYAELANSPIPF
jgi:hypothetical protein